MALVNHELIWQFDVNQVITGATSAANNGSLLFSIKESLKNFSINPWTVVGSSNASTAGIDGVDRWVTAGNLVWASGNRSWIILKQTGLSSNFQLLIALNDTLSYEIGIIQISPSAGFTGGTIGANPTATDAVTLTAASTNWGGSGVAMDTTNCSVLHVMQSTDGYCTRVFAFRDSAPGFPILIWNFERIRNAVPELTYPYFCNAKGTNSTPATVFNSYGAYRTFTTTTGYWKCPHAGSSINIQYSSEGMGSYLLTAYLQSKNDISGEYDVYPCGVVSLDAAYKGRYGEVYDFFLAPAGTHLFYYNDADNNTRKWIQLANMIVPWDGSYIVLG